MRSPYAMAGGGEGGRRRRPDRGVSRSGRRGSDDAEERRARLVPR
uniref:Uncharacterized protein n=1 Tax=Arundo donax TaxID=35708 RepID=A0A0A9HPV0_ARUDO